MFKRPFTAKTSSPLRSSDARKLRTELSTLFDLPASSPLLKVLVPEGLLSYKATTHLDEHIIVFSSPTTADPLFFRIGKGGDGVLVPTCYACDLVEGLLPELVTAPQVVEHLVSGSALFSTGISDASLSGLPNSMLEGSLVAVTAQGSARVVAIGHLAASKKELVKDRKGKAVLTLHARGDFLWKSGTEVVAIPLPIEDRVEKLSADLSETSLEAPISGVDLKSPDEPIASTSAAVADSSSVSTIDLIPADVDQVLLTALLLAIQTLSATPSLLPLPASSFYSSYILPCRPATPPHSSVEIKKSTWKKLTGLIKEANKRGWLVAKEVKGDLLVMGVNGTHKDVLGVKSYRTLGQKEKKEKKAADAEEVESSAKESAITVTELYKPPSSFNDLLQVLTNVQIPTNDLYTYSALLHVLKSYITAQDLSHPRDQKFLKLDSVLETLLKKKGEEIDILSKDEASKRLIKLCTHYWEMRRAGEGEGEGIIKKGTPPIVKIAIKSVGKRMVTLVSGYEAWNLFTGEELAEDLKHRAASSTAIQPVTGSSPKKPLFEIMVQGSHELLVMKVLIERGLPKAYVEVDKSKAKR